MIDQCVDFWLDGVRKSLDRHTHNVKSRMIDYVYTLISHGMCVIFESSENEPINVLYDFMRFENVKIQIPYNAQTRLFKDAAENQFVMITSARRVEVVQTFHNDGNVSYTFPCLGLRNIPYVRSELYAVLERVVKQLQMRTFNSLSVDSNSSSGEI